MLRLTATRSLRALAPTARALPAVGRAAPSLAARASSPFTFRSLSVSAPRAVPTSLSTKIGEELQFEADHAEEGEPEFLQEFKKEGIWQIEDVAGADEVILTRNYTNEQIRLIFSISDLDAEQDSALPEEDDAAVAEAEDDAPGPSEESFPVETSITITKDGQGALTIDAVAQDGMFTISNISFYNDAKLATDMSSEADWKRQGLYMGPAFENLDDGVQGEFETFLEERGINSSLALFIPDLAEHKEQKEYVSWLGSVKGFLEA